MAKELERKGERGRGLEPWRPFGELEGWPGGFGAGFPWRSSLFADWPWRERPGGFLPAMDVSENDERYLIRLELPGGNKDGVLTTPVPKTERARLRTLSVKAG